LNNEKLVFFMKHIKVEEIRKHQTVGACMGKIRPLARPKIKSETTTTTTTTATATATTATTTVASAAATTTAATTATTLYVCLLTYWH
jgi:hypothetical protein